MGRIPFTKAHGAKNDFLLTWAGDAPPGGLAAAARAICGRHTGVGADGWLLVSPGKAGECDGAIRLFNSDGSEAEISGNGTRCAAAFLIDAGVAAGPEVTVATGAGLKLLRLLERQGLRFLFEMNMGRPRCQPEQIRHRLTVGGEALEATILDVGNPQCAVEVADFDFDWRALGARLERHEEFPNRTNVSFFRRLDEHSIETRFYERGAGETMSSGTGSTGAAAAAILKGAAVSPVRVHTPAGIMDVRWDGEVWLTGPAEIVAGGEFYLETDTGGFPNDSQR